MIAIYIKPDCPYCKRLLRLLERTDLEYETRDVTYEKIHYDDMIKITRDNGVPQVRMNNVMIFDYDTEPSLVEDIKKIQEAGAVDEEWMTENTSSKSVIMKSTDVEK